jgi:prepilin-type N-terminal cleavage/methylation domain-containing protein
MQTGLPCPPSQRSRGFTLVEVVVVLAVVLLLSAIAVPLVTGYIEDGRRTRATAEIKTIAGAVTNFYKDYGKWPARSNAGVDNVLFVLYTGSALPAANPFAAAHQFDTWALNGTNGDVLDNQLLRNTPKGSAGGAYPTTGQFIWRGPYLAGGMGNDPWNRPYVINVTAGHSTDAINYKRMFVLSAGANGVIDTPAAATATTDIAGDDIGIIINQRS